MLRGFEDCKEAREIVGCVGGAHANVEHLQSEHSGSQELLVLL